MTARVYFYDGRTGKELKGFPHTGKCFIAVSGNITIDGRFVKGTCDSVEVASFASSHRVSGHAKITKEDFPDVGIVKVKIWTPGRPGSPAQVEWRHLMTNPNTPKLPTVDRAQCTEERPHHFVTEASDLELGPGDWPEALATKMGNGQLFRLAGIVRDHEQETLYALYRQDLGCIDLKVFND